MAAAGGARGPARARIVGDDNPNDGADDIVSEEYRVALRRECRTLDKAIAHEDSLAFMYNDERIRISYFWMVGKKELEDKEAELRNKEREYQDLREKHQIEIKIYMQRLMHLMFQNTDQLTQMKKEAQITLKNSEDGHRIQERELKADLRALKVQKKEQEGRQQEYLNSLHRTYNKKMTAIRNEHERHCNEIQIKYKNRMLELRMREVKRRKAAIEKIEKKKDNNIKETTMKHDKKYIDIKDYYQEITTCNLDIIRFLKDELEDYRKKEGQSIKEHAKKQKENKGITGPLYQAKKDKAKYRARQELHIRIKNELEKCQEEIREIDGVYRENEWEYEVRLQQYNYLEKERQGVFDEFHRLVYEMHQKAGLRNLILEKKLETIQEELDQKEASINQIISAANIHPDQVGMVRNTLDEVEHIKNEAIKSIQTELKKIREAHSNMVKTYEGKLSEFGIPVEELGFDPLVPANI